jgi:hypothetical protein
MAWWITFTIVSTFLLYLGFGPAGIIPGKSSQIMTEGFI